MGQRGRLRIAMLLAAGLSAGVTLPLQAGVVAPASPGAGASMASAAANCALTLRGFFQSSTPDLASLNGAASYLSRLDLNDPAVHAALEPIRAELAVAVRQIYAMAPEEPGHPYDDDSNANQLRMLTASEKMAVLTLPAFQPYLRYDDRSNMRTNAELYRRSLSQGNQAKLTSKMNAIAEALGRAPALEGETALVVAHASRLTSNDPYPAKLQPYDASRLPLKFAAQRILENLDQQKPIFNRMVLEASIIAHTLKSQTPSETTSEQLFLAEAALEQIKEARGNFFLKQAEMLADVQAVLTTAESAEIQQQLAELRGAFLVGEAISLPAEVLLVPLGSGRGAMIKAGSKAAGLKFLSALTTPFRTAPFRFVARLYDKVSQMMESTIISESFNHPIMLVPRISLALPKLLNFLGEAAAARKASTDVLPSARVLSKPKAIKQLTSGSASPSETPLLPPGKGDRA